MGNVGAERIPAVRDERPGRQGAGRGLDIVAQFAQVMNAEFELGDVPDGAGLRATVTFRTLPAPS